MRSYFVLGITVILVLTLDIAGRYRLNRMGREGSETALSLEIQQSEAAMAAAEAYFEENKGALALLADHSHRYALESLLIEARGALEAGDGDALREKARLLALAWREPGQAAALTWDNLI